MTYDKTNTGVLFGDFDANETETERNRPNFTGTINIEGKDYRLAGWVKVGKAGGKLAGRKFCSLTVSEPQAKATENRPASNYDWKRAERETAPTESQRQPPPDDFDDDIPF